MSMPKLLFYLHIDQIFKEGKFFKESLKLAGIEALNEGVKYSTFTDVYFAKTLKKI